MPLAIVPIGQIFGKYEHQARIAELNRKTPIKTIQNQADRVSISSEARKAQVLGIARAVRESSKHLITESQNLDDIKPTTEAGEKSLSFSESVVQKALEKSHDAKG